MLLGLQPHFLHFSSHLSSLLCRLLPLKNLSKPLEERILTFSILCLLETTVAEPTSLTSVSDTLRSKRGYFEMHV